MRRPAQDVLVAYTPKLLKKSTLEIYEKFPHGMCTTHADVINADLLAFIKRGTGRLCGKEGDTQ